MTEITDVKSAMKWTADILPTTPALQAAIILRAEVLRLRAELSDATKGPPIKYSRDGSNTITIRQLIDRLKAVGTSDVDKFCDVLDTEFLFGVWGHYFDMPDKRLFLKDLRGLIYAVFHERTADN